MASYQPQRMIVDYLTCQPSPKLYQAQILVDPHPQKLAYNAHELLEQRLDLRQITRRISHPSHLAIRQIRQPCPSLSRTYKSRQHELIDAVGFQSMKYCDQL